MLRVAKHKETELYSARLLSFLLDNQVWIKQTQPSIEEVIEQIMLSNQRSNMWIGDLQEAETWDEYYINQWKEYLPDVEFVEVQLTTD